MSRRAGATQAEIRRIIKAAIKEGLHIVGIKPDGTVIVDNDSISVLPAGAGLDAQSLSRSDWEDIEA